MKRGFTLIELLAVLILLAIIALIVTPIVLGAISDSRKSSMKVSVEHYVDAIEIAVSHGNVNTEYGTLDGIYEISNDGRTLTREDGATLTLTYDGKGLTEGMIIVENGLVKQIINGPIDKWYAGIISGKVELVDEISNSNTLLTGQEFNAAIKNLVIEEEVTHESEDIIITSIEFLPYGLLPKGHTKETLTTLESVDVSEKQDKSIMAYYNGNGKVYIYSEEGILGNTDCTRMFQFFRNLTNLDLTYFDTSNTTIMFGLFNGCSSLKTLNLSNWNTKKVTTMQAMFEYTTNLSCIQVGDDWQLASTVTDMFNGSGVSTTQTDSCVVTSS